MILPQNLTTPLSTPKIFNALLKLNFSEYPREKIFHLIRQLGKYTCIVHNLPPGTIILRARVNYGTEVFSAKSQVSYNPQNANTLYQRASTPHTTMFYGAVNPDGSLIEKNEYKRIIGLYEVSSLVRDESIIEGEERITFSKWIVTKSIPIVPIIYNFNNIPNGPFAENLGHDISKFEASFPEDQVKKGRLVSEFFENEFSKIETVHDYDYMLSAIYTEMLCRNQSVSLAGVLYPSVRTKELKGKGFNIAITPDYVENNLKLDVVVECTFYKKKNQIICDNDKEVILEDGQTDFVLKPITDPKVHIGKERVYHELTKALQ